jgi:hypothetical protein
VHAADGPPSSEQVVLVTVPVVVQANVEYHAPDGTVVKLTVGGPAATDVTVHEYGALDEPAAFETVTTNRCEPTASPEYERGDVHALATPSSEHVTLVGEPVVVHANDAEVEVVEDAGVDVSVTVAADGPGGGGGGGDPESRSVPKSCVQYQ